MLAEQTKIEDEAAIKAVLRGLIDRHTLGRVLDLVALVCAEKQNYVECWYDVSLGLAWEKAHRTVERAALSVYV